MDLFVVFTVSFRLLYVLFIIRHGRRQIMHFNATEHPTATWVVQQLREAFPYDSGPRHLIFDRDSIFSAEVVAMITAMGIKTTRTAHRSPWQDGTAERWARCGHRAGVGNGLGGASGPPPLSEAQSPVGGTLGRGYDE